MTTKSGKQIISANTLNIMSNKRFMGMCLISIEKELGIDSEGSILFNVMKGLYHKELNT
jgi:hypothetical protein